MFTNTHFYKGYVYLNTTVVLHHQSKNVKQTETT